MHTRLSAESNPPFEASERSSVIVEPPSSLCRSD